MPLNMHNKEGQGCLKSCTTKKGKDASKHAQQRMVGMPQNMHKKEGQGSLKISKTKKGRDAPIHPYKIRAWMP